MWGPMANVMLSLMQDIGLTEVKSFGDSTGRFDLTSVPAATAAE